MNTPPRIVPAAVLLGGGLLPGLLVAGVVDGTATVWATVLSAIIALATERGISGAFIRSGTHRILRAAGSSVAGGVAVVGAVVLLWPDASGRGTVSASADAVAFGWSAVITSPVPAAAEPRMLVPVALAAWAAVLVGLVFTRHRDPPILALAPVGAAIVAASIVAGRNPYAPAVVAVGVVVVASSALIGRASRRRLGAGVGMAAVAALVGVAAGPLLAFGRSETPFDPRDHIDPPSIPETSIHPLELVGLWRQRPDTPMFIVRSPEALPTRLAAFDSFDGERWTQSTGYERAGTRIAVPERSGTTVRTVNVEIELSGLDGPWLPSVADPVRVTGADVLVDPGAGTLLSTTQELPISYTLVARTSEPDVDSMQYLPVVTGDDEPSAPPTLPADLRQLSAMITESATTPFTKVVVLQRHLRSMTVDPTAGSGHSYGHLRQALLEDEAGTAEQFATGFAVLARSIGMPTRVVVGFGPGEAIDARSYEVRSGDVRVWPEVHFAGAGWVAFDPTPQRESAVNGDTLPIGLGGQQIQVVERDPGIGLERDDAGPELPDNGPEPGPGAIDSAADPSVDDSWSGWPLLGVGLTALVTMLSAAPAMVVLAKRRRTARRRAAVNGRDRVLGAWDDVVDRISERGMNQVRFLTVKDVVETADQRGSLTGLYRPACRALYGADEVSDTDAEHAWRARDLLVESTRDDASVASRMRWAVDPTPLLLRSRPTARTKSGA